MSHEKVNSFVFIMQAFTDLFGKSFDCNFGRICNQCKQYLQILANVYSKILPWSFGTMSHRRNNLLLLKISVLLIK